MKAFIAVLALVMMSACSADFFGTLPGRHWRMTISSSDASVSSNDVVKIADQVASRLGLAITWVDPKNKIIELSDSPKPGALRITIISDPKGSMLVVSTDSTDRSFDIQAEEGRVIAVLKALYPHSEGASFVAYRGLLGP